MFEDRCYNCKMWSNELEICFNTGRNRSGVAFACEAFEKDHSGHCVICCRKLPVGKHVCAACSGRGIEG